MEVDVPQETDDPS